MTSSASSHRGHVAFKASASTIPYVDDASYLRISTPSTTMICLETDGKEENDDHWPSTVPYVNDASYLRISSTSNTTDSEEDDDDYRPRTLDTHHFIADRPPAPFNESFNDEEVVDEITGNNESVQLLGEISLPEATIVPSPDLWWDLEKPLIAQPARCKEASFSIAASAIFWKKKDISNFERIRLAEIYRAVEWK